MIILHPRAGFIGTITPIHRLRVLVSMPASGYVVGLLGKTLQYVPLFAFKYSDSYLFFHRTEAK